MENFRPNADRAKNAIILISIVLALEIISFISGYYKYDLLQTASNGGFISMEAANSTDNREQIIGVISLIAYFISGITFILWFRRAYFNLHLKAKLLSYTEGWAAGSWFVPIVNLYRPYHIMKELYQETEELILKKGLTINEPFSTNFLGWWWSLWIINNFIGQFVFRYSMNAETIEELTFSTTAGMISNIVGIPLALITIKIIKDYSEVDIVFSRLIDDEPIEHKGDLV